MSAEGNEVLAIQGCEDGPRIIYIRKKKLLSKKICCGKHLLDPTEICRGIYFWHLSPGSHEVLAMQGREDAPPGRQGVGEVAVELCQFALQHVELKELSDHRPRPLALVWGNYLCFI